MKHNNYNIRPANLGKFMAELIRVNHSGELGAKFIYQGQLAVIRNPKARKLIEEMKAQEQEHLDYFSQEMVKRKVRPSLLVPLWKVGGWMLGASTAFLGAKAAMACTEAVEEVIDEHYKSQLDSTVLDEELAEAIELFREEENEHRSTAIANGSENAILHPLLTAAIRTITRTAIAVAKKI